MRKNREQVRITVESVRGGARCLWRIGFEKKKSIVIGMKEWWGDGWHEWWWWRWRVEMIMEVWWVKKRQVVGEVSEGVWRRAIRLYYGSGAVAVVPMQCCCCCCVRWSSTACVHRCL